MSDQSKALGNEAFKLGNYQEAVRFYTEAIQANPKDEVLFSNRSAAKLKGGDAAGAAEDAATSLSLNDSYWKAYSRLGDALFVMTNYQDALEAYLRSLQLNPDNSVTLNSLQEVKKHLVKRSQAIYGEDDPSYQPPQGKQDVTSYLRDQAGKIFESCWTNSVERGVLCKYLPLHVGFRRFFKELEKEKRHGVMEQAQEALAQVNFPGSLDCLLHMKRLCLEEPEEFLRWLDALGCFQTEIRSGKAVIADLLLTPRLAVSTTDDYVKKFDSYVGLNDLVIEGKRPDDVNNDIFSNIQTLLTLTQVYFEGFFQLWVKREGGPSAKDSLLEDIGARLTWTPLRQDATKLAQQVKSKSSSDAGVIYFRLARDPSAAPKLLQPPHNQDFVNHVRVTGDFHLLAIALSHGCQLAYSERPVLSESVGDLVFDKVARAKLKEGSLAGTELVRCLANLLAADQPSAVRFLVKKREILQAVLAALKDTLKAEDKGRYYPHGWELLRCLVSLARYRSLSAKLRAEGVDAAVGTFKSSSSVPIRALAARFDELLQGIGPEVIDDGDVLVSSEVEEPVKETEITYTCANCGKASPDCKNCGSCKRVRYCSKDCQRIHWPSHKIECKATQK